jgi:hypothetical protein
MSTKRFRIAFSFAGEKRGFVSEVAAILATRFSEAEILYDKFHEAEFARRDLGIYLSDLYQDQSELIVVVMSPNYDEKQWTGLEWAAIHDLLSKRKPDAVMLCRFGHATVGGLYSTAGFVELDSITPAQAAERILERLALNEGKPRDHYIRSIPASAPIVIVADLDEVPADLVAEFMGALDELHRAAGGGGLEIRSSFTGSDRVAGVTI